MKNLLTAAFLIFAGCAPVAAQGLECAPATDIEAYLEVEYGEELAVYGLTNNGDVLEFWVNNHTDTWTLILRQGDMRCPLEAGQNGASNVIGEVF